MKSVNRLFLICCVSFCAFADDALPTRFGKVIAIKGKATAKKPDGAKQDLRVGDELPAGSIIKTDANGSVDLFFRRIGTIVQVDKNSELRLEKLEMSKKDGKLLKRTELTLSEGRILTCVRVLIPESKVIVKTPKVTFQAPGTGMGRFEFRADGSALVGRRSKLTLIADAGGQLSTIMPGQFYSKGTPAEANPSFFEEFTKRMDALQKTTQELTPPPAPEELP